MMIKHIARLYLSRPGNQTRDLISALGGGLGFNFGYLALNFYPPLIYYVVIFHLIGFNLLWSFKLMIIPVLFSSIGMYLLGKRFLIKKPAYFRQLIYIFFYRAITIYIRGAWAEFFAMSILPFCFLG